MKFFVEDRVFQAIPGLSVVVIVAKGIEHSEETGSETKQLLQTYWKEGAVACESYPNVQSHPHIKAWRDCFQSLGISVKKYKSSVESLLKRATKQLELSPINALVDLYNAISVRYIVPFGAFDIDDLPAELPLELRFTKPSDTFMALDESKYAPVAGNEIGYVTGSEVVTRHINWKQSKRGLVKQLSTNVIFVGEILPSVPRSLVEQMIGDFVVLVKDLFHAECRVDILHSGNPSFLC